eukprot:COSAG03_NODE_552_length_6970_cov_232.041140_7_plen_160_part_00
MPFTAQRRTYHSVRPIQPRSFSLVLLEWTEQDPGLLTPFDAIRRMCRNVPRRLTRLQPGYCNLVGTDRLPRVSPGLCACAERVRRRETPSSQRGDPYPPALPLEGTALYCTQYSACTPSRSSSPALYSRDGRSLARTGWANWPWRWLGCSRAQADMSAV